MFMESCSHDFIFQVIESLSLCHIIQCRLLSKIWKKCIDDYLYSIAQFKYTYNQTSKRHLPFYTVHFQKNGVKMSNTSSVDNNHYRYIQEIFIGLDCNKPTVHMYVYDKFCLFDFLPYLAKQLHHIHNIHSESNMMKHFRNTKLYSICMQIVYINFHRPSFR